ncbi:MAG: glutamine-hydrolyzing carbamoyl-phosphate synthase small subunit [Thaumarchaeota archaeon]|nr:glutamine-hydrolyzing carbamoyl-phosphate synthase small subunit [Candidatus Terraquivivens yellowstonensis]MCL7392384.1 glutamine-hydrolyzing carbamoyl-phosphate synthase small subunit [Candidatus Terraquivivens yellowstonensis]MCL7397852.1 glutamine-hydrolyzing carbamoyl-phosphate synthase small subunit [Candidatus Terraquivivens yellowstonensis]MCL7398943.1 glutamine-hydrolyzing carbamoyl-phosphate synthase small subunit [Candidatus Terraquivivens yellowstonensis]MCL7400557.1 glutamine-hy
MTSPNRKKALLVLEDGTILRGEGFGALGEAMGELVFNTSMTGYVEALTDPSYAGQILMMTYPLIGNYGVCDEDYESDGIKVEGFVVRELCETPSNWRSKKSLSEFLEEYGVPGIQGVDTRMLTRKIRIYGTMKSTLIVYEGNDEPNIDEVIEKTKAQPAITELDLVNKVSVSKPTFIEGDNDLNVVLIDCGVKWSIIRLLKKNANIILVPYNTPAKKILEYDPDGVLISNGPGDPIRVKETINTAKELAGKVVLFGICLGHQIISLALGAKTFKLKFGHRGANQPVKDFESGRVFISTQNHGFAVSKESLKDAGLILTQINLNDYTVEGVKHKELPIKSVQYHPEGGPGPHDTYFFFDDFVKTMKEYG